MMDDQREGVKPIMSLPPKACPRCRLTNPGTAERCDCGYDFITQTMETPYLREKPPQGLKTFVRVVVGLGVFIAAISLFSGDGPRLIVSLVWIPAVLWAYSQFMRRKNWARIALAILTAPLGLFLLLSPEMSMYCRRKA